MCFTPLSRNGFRRILLDGALLVGMLESSRLDPVKIIRDSGASMLAFSPVMRRRLLFLYFVRGCATGARAREPACWWSGRMSG